MDPHDHEWKVELAVSGPVTTRARRSLNVLKGHTAPWQTQVTLENQRYGVKVAVIARARDLQGAHDAAVFFVGEALDYLAFKLDLPLFLSSSCPELRDSGDNVRRVVTEAEWREVFELGRKYGANYPAITKALSWYRKGLTSENPVDRYLAFWNVLEVLGAGYHQQNERTSQGIINQICNCFDQLWESCEHWPVVAGRPERVNQFHGRRNAITHGFQDIDVQSLREISDDTDELRELSRALLEAVVQKFGEPR